MKIYFHCVRCPDGTWPEWSVIATLPDEWPEGSTADICQYTGNRIYYVPGDGVRYYEMLDGAVCSQCGTVIDKSWMFHVEAREDRDKCLCRKCWGAVTGGRLDLPQAIGDMPLYLLKNPGANTPAYL